jgi:hypothetical protein
MNNAILLSGGAQGRITRSHSYVGSATGHPRSSAHVPAHGPAGEATSKGDLS